MCRPITPQTLAKHLGPWDESRMVFAFKIPCLQGILFSVFTIVFITILHIWNNNDYNKYNLLILFYCKIKIIYKIRRKDIELVL